MKTTLHLTDYDELIQEAVETWMPGCDWRLYKAQLWAESRFIPDAVSPAGAIGMAQIIPKTWPKWSIKAGYFGKDQADPEASIHTGACYMAYLISQWSWPRPEIDRHCLALASYNAGLGHILKAQKLSGNKSLYHEIMPHLVTVTGDDDAPETIGYVKKILGYWVKLITN